MSYSIKRTDKFNDQLIDIILSTNESFSKKEAVEYLNYIELQINVLKDYPKIVIVPRYQAIAKQGYRALICKQNIIFYKVSDEKQEIILEIIVSAKRNYMNLI